MLLASGLRSLQNNRLAWTLFSTKSSSPPRLSFADVALECKLVNEVHIGSPGATLCILEVVLAHVSDSVAQPDGLPDPHTLRAVARLGERSYLNGNSWQVVERPRPEVSGDLSIHGD